MGVFGRASPTQTPLISPELCNFCYICCLRLGYQGLNDIIPGKYRK